MKKKVLLTWIFALILLAVSVSAQPPFLVQEAGTFAEGMVIDFPEMIAISVDEDHDFSFHVFNSTTGSPIVNGLSCYLHLFDRQGLHQHQEIKTEIEPDVPGSFDFTYKLDKGNFSEVGLLYYVIQCNNSNAGGFASTNFAVTPDGRIIIEAQGTIYATVIFVAVMILLITLFFAWNIDGKNKFKIGTDILEVNFNKYVKIFLWLMSYQLLLFISFMVLKTAERFLFFGFITVMFDWLFIILLAGEIPVFFIVVYVSFVQMLFDLKILEWAKRGLKPR